ncbi:MAG: Gfo/Idh/MocA family oxidoreductase [Candidatus Acidiferrales bacterium]
MLRKSECKVILRAGVIGCGRIGCGFDDDPQRPYASSHARAYLRTAGVELAALCDTDGANLERYGTRFGVRERYRDYNEMLEKGNLDVVSICTLSTSHLEVVRAVVGNGVRGIFCEKPIAESLSGADEMIRLCVEHGVALMIGHQRRFDPMHQRLAQFVRDGGVGRVQQGTCYYTAGVANTGTHLFDLLRLYLGDVAWVRGHMSASKSPNAADPNIDGWLGFMNGAVVALQALDVAAYTIFETVLLGTKGRLRLGSHGFRAEFEEARSSNSFSGYRELFAAQLPVEGELTQELLICGITHLIDCVEHGAKPISSGEDGRAALEIICALSQSAVECGKRIDLPLASTSLTIPSK